MELPLHMLTLLLPYLFLLVFSTCIYPLNFLLTSPIYDVTDIFLGGKPAPYKAVKKRMSL